MAARYSSNAALFLWGAAIALALWVLWTAGGSPVRVYDDAFITYRYAANLAAGRGLTYNPGEWVLGTTTPLWTLLLALVTFALRIDPVLAGYWLSAAAAAGVILLGGVLLHQHGNSPAAAGFMPLAASLRPLYDSYGMETAFLLALMFTVAIAWRSERFWLTVLAGAALGLTRHDAVLWLLALGVAVIWRTGRIPWREGVAVALLTLPWFAFAAWRYGTPLPNSAAAKLGQNAWMAVTGQPEFAQAFLDLLTTPFPASSGLVFLAAGLWGVVETLRGREGSWWLPLWLAAYLHFYTIIDIALFPWYLAPPAVVFAFLLAVGLAGLAKRIPRGRAWSRFLPLAGALLFSFPLLRDLEANIGHPKFNPAYLDAAAWLRDNTSPDARVAAIEIGAVGYYSERPILDTMGLVSIEMTDHQVGWAETLTYAVTTARPEYALAIDGTAWDLLRGAWWFDQTYAPVAKTGNLTVLARQPAPPLGEPLAVEAGNGHFRVAAVRLGSLELRSETPLEVAVELDVLAEVPVDYELIVYLKDVASSTWVVTAQQTPFSGLYQGSRWRMGDTLSVPLHLHIPEDLPWGGYRLGLRFEPLDEGGTGEAVDMLAGWLRRDRPPPANIPTPNLLDWPPSSWTNGLRLEKLGIQPLGGAADEVGPHDLYFGWHAVEPVDRSLTLFIHLVNAEGDLIAQFDQPPAGGRWPTTVWPPGDGWVDVVPIDWPAGAVALRLGWYDDNGRIPLETSPSQDFIEIPIFAVGAP